MVKIKMYGTRWCGDTFRARKVLDEVGMDYEYIDINKDAEGEQFVKETNHGNRSVPTIVFPDGSILVEPTNKELKEKMELFR
ncbi:MAG: glutaredoxin domain-containing protein [Chloroflexota bacterium]|jgi:mycoredoxin|nr:glutaredoxin domain-containing protein [Chloroflexota bacterium]